MPGNITRTYSRTSDISRQLSRTNTNPTGRDHEREVLDEENQHEAKPDGTSPATDPDVEVVDWDGPNDPENPFNWNKNRKIILTVVTLFGCMIVLLNGTSMTVAAANINASFGISDAKFPNSYWPILSWTIGGAVFVLTLLPLVEDLGVRWAYLVTYGVFLISLVPLAVAQNFWTIIIVRFFSGGCVILIANVAAGIICDMWEGDRGRAVPMAAFVTCYLVGSSLGPVIGGAIIAHLSWRWIFWIQLIWYGAFYPVFILVVRETRASVILRHRAERIRATTDRKAYTYEELHGPPVIEVLKVSIMRPLKMLATEYVVFSLTLWSSFSVGLLYLFTQSVEQVFGGLYGFSSSAAGYVQGAIVVGELLGFLASFYASKLYFASASRNTEHPGEPIPEARLYLSVVGGFVGLAGGMFVYAWTSYPNLPWIAPAIGLAMVGFGINLIVNALADYITDAYSKYASSAISCLAFGENIFSAFLPLAAQSMYSSLGFQWASSLLAFLGVLLAFAPVVLLTYGRQIRGRSPFMSEASYDREKETTPQNERIM